MQMTDHPLRLLAERFPQLYIPLNPGARESLQYKNMVLRGQESDRELRGFSFSETDKLTLWQTPAGPVEVLYLENRADFEHCVCALAYRCEPRPIPASMGATTLSGLNDWGRIRAHRAAYEEAGGKEWQKELRRFTADPANYRATLILVSRGCYSAVPSEMMNLPPAEWLDRSLTIRTYHELTHFVCRKWYPQDLDPIRDEVIADAIGLVAAFGTYDPRKAALFLGIESDTYRQGGRLENYQKEGQSLEEAINTARSWIRRAADILRDLHFDDYFAPIRFLMAEQKG